LFAYSILYRLNKRLSMCINESLARGVRLVIDKKMVFCKNVKIVLSPIKAQGGLMRPIDFEADVSHSETSTVPERRLEHIGEYPITEIRSTIEKLAEFLGDKGGILRLYRLGENSKDMHSLFCEAFGFFDEPRKNRPIFERFSEEKAVRLWKHSRHHSSYESRNRNKELYGGAIRTKNGFIISCSGMSEQEDEAISLCLAVHLCWLSKEEAERISKKSGNAVFKRLLKNIS